MNRFDRLCIALAIWFVIGLTFAAKMSDRFWDWIIKIVSSASSALEDRKPL